MIRGGVERDQHEEKRIACESGMHSKHRGADMPRSFLAEFEPVTDVVSMISGVSRAVSDGSGSADGARRPGPRCCILGCARDVSVGYRRSEGADRLIAGT